MSDKKTNRPPNDKQLAFFKSRRASHAVEIHTYFNTIGIDTFQFPKNPTPHIRIANRVDYWTATTRYVNKITGEAGWGFERLKDVVDRALDGPEFVDLAREQRALNPIKGRQPRKPRPPRPPRPPKRWHGKGSTLSSRVRFKAEEPTQPVDSTPPNKGPNAVLWKKAQPVKKDDQFDC